MVTKALGRQPHRFLFRIWWELRPFYLPAAAIRCGIGMVLADGWVKGLYPIVFLVDLVIWRINKNLGDDDDDPWKRRRKKLAEKVEAVGGKLTVVPAGAPS
jgi:hypothetical protein